MRIQLQPLILSKALQQTTFRNFTIPIVTLALLGARASGAITYDY